MQSYTFTLSEYDAVSVRCALHRALANVDKIIADYAAMDPIYLATVQKYEAEKADIRAALDAINLQFYAQVDQAIEA